MTDTILQTIYRFPFKGFPGEKLHSAKLIAGAGIPNDRRYAVTNGKTYTGEWIRSRNFFVNATVDNMMQFKLEFENDEITLENINGKILSFKVNDEESLSNANAQIKDFMQPVGVMDDLPPPEIIDCGKGSIWDYIDTPISIINTESVKALDSKLGSELDPKRFRGNFNISGLPAWEEFSWMGKRIQVGETILDVHRPIDRCPTPGVNPKTGERDVEVTPGLRDHFGHIYCGMYANVIEGGEVTPGDTIKVIGDAEIKLEDTFVSNASNYALWPRMAEVIDCKVEEQKTLITLRGDGPWPLSDASEGQRVRLHLGDAGWTVEYISAVQENKYVLEVEDSKTEDPITQELRRGFEIGSKIVISGPYGRV